MRHCKNCGRPLEDNEEKLCPACKSEKSHKKKRLGEIIGGVLGVVLVIFFGRGFGGGGKKS